MKELYDEMRFVMRLKKCAEVLIKHEKELYNIHKNEEGRLQVIFTFEEDGATMYITTDEE